jgi:ribosomal small subunit protein bTHX
MGKGDKKTAKGKRRLSSYGKSRPKKKPNFNTSSTKDNKPS